MAYDSDDTTGDFLDRAGQIPLLTPSQEITLARKVQRALAIAAKFPDGPHTPEQQRVIKAGNKARQRLVAANLRLVVYVVRKTRLRGIHSLPMDDLIQEGTFGLTRAVEKFDPERGYKFSTYAYRWIQQSIRRAYSQQAHLIRTPTHLAERLASRSMRTTEFLAAHGRLPTRQELAEALNTTAAELDLLDHRTAIPLCLEHPTGINNRPLADAIPDDRNPPDDHGFDVDDDQIHAALLTLSDDVRRMVIMRFGFYGHDPSTLTVIADRLGCTRENVRQRLNGAIRQLRSTLRATPTEEAAPPPCTIARYLTSRSRPNLMPASINPF